MLQSKSLEAKVFLPFWVIIATSSKQTWHGETLSLETCRISLKLVRVKLWILDNFEANPSLVEVPLPSELQFQSTHGNFLAFYSSENVCMFSRLIEFPQSFTWKLTRRLSSWNNVSLWWSQHATFSLSNSIVNQKAPTHLEKIPSVGVAQISAADFYSQWKRGKNVWRTQKRDVKWVTKRVLTCGHVPAAESTSRKHYTAAVKEHTRNGCRRIKLKGIFHIVVS